MTVLSTCPASVRLVLYSDQVIAANRKLDLEVLRLLDRSVPRIGYLTSAPDPERRFFNAKQAYYAQYGAIDLVYFEPDQLDAPETLAGLLACDAIHLAGGDTRGYLARLKRANLIEPLRRYACGGGILIGTSAGAILMTPSIAVNALFESAAPADSPEQSALDLVPFEFFPHLQAEAGYRASLIRYSRTNAGRVILACADGDGVIVENGAVKAVGVVTTIRDGEAD